MSIQIMNSKIWPLIESLIPSEVSGKGVSGNVEDFDIAVLFENGEFINGGLSK